MTCCVSIMHYAVHMLCTCTHLDRDEGARPADKAAEEGAAGAAGAAGATGTTDAGQDSLALRKAAAKEVCSAFPPTFTEAHMQCPGLCLHSRAYSGPDGEWRFEVEPPLWAQQID